MKKKLTAIALVVALLAIAVIGGSLAYFTDTDKADNVFTVGNVDIELTEDSWEEAEDVYPGQALPKDPVVTNIGNNPCFVRIKVTGLDELGEGNTITYETADSTTGLGEGWVEGTDGYFYYTEILAPEASTTELFEQIRIPTTATNEESGEYTVTVFAEAVQAQGSGIETVTAAALATWFGTCMPTT